MYNKCRFALQNQVLTPCNAGLADVYIKQGTAAAASTLFVIMVMIETKLKFC